MKKPPRPPRAMEGALLDPAALVPVAEPEELEEESEVPELPESEEEEEVLEAEGVL